ncbi:MAG TPA: hypothetical protein VFU19_21135 [Iamia sp.]|nr:hypothetical protein [Iamia sp.]
MGITRRASTLVLALGLLVGGAAACSDDDGDTAGEGTEESTTTAAGDEPQPTPPGDDSAPEGGEDDVEAANDAVIQEYCDASEAYAAALEAGDPEALEEASGRLGEASDAVAPVVETFTAAQQAQFEECTDAQGG